MHTTGWHFSVWCDTWVHPSSATCPWRSSSSHTQPEASFIGTNAKWWRDFNDKSKIYFQMLKASSLKLMSSYETIATGVPTAAEMMWFPIIERITCTIPQTTLAGFHYNFIRLTFCTPWMNIDKNSCNLPKFQTHTGNMEGRDSETGRQLFTSMSAGPQPRSG